ncbi:hypothetical protein SM007_38295 [Streptomyces avermitilis]|uniref:Uncharacterized protein n=2 Tax=Streptomyces avermitilis TaxID=33903 RepID=A0A4D4MFW4_STRAX|nr:hypothetical protein SM007_38295 [Streptomyces avermitilis]GDY68713.1 hypothetical protein SAV14893_081060 [Streptomyces avermitilis]GDY70908.1 hypothetical protein SAV31267_003930 [Streptomyces avermitilis]
MIGFMGTDIHGFIEVGGELPWRTGLGHRRDVDVRSGTERIGAYPLLASRDPAQCDADRSTPNPSPIGSTASDICHP